MLMVNGDDDDDDDDDDGDNDDDDDDGDDDGDDDSDDDGDGEHMAKISRRRRLGRNKSLGCDCAHRKTPTRLHVKS